MTMTMTSPEIVQRAKEQLVSLTGLHSDTVSSIGRDSDGWRVTVELVEVRRIPSTSDVIGTYDVRLDTAGDLLSYQRTRRYYRSQVSD